MLMFMTLVVHTGHLLIKKRYFNVLLYLSVTLVNSEYKTDEEVQIINCMPSAYVSCLQLMHHSFL